MKRKNQNKHFTFETRIIIENELNEGNTITAISNKLYRDRSNIGREIEKHKQLVLPNSYGNTCCCSKKRNCNKIHYNCQNSCKDFEIDLCEKLKSSPHVCNGCATKNGCRKAKYYYKAKEANEQYLEKLVVSRSNMHYTELELSVLNNDFYNLVLQTKSIYHSLRVINATGFNFKLKTIYRQIKDGLLRLKISDLPRANQKKKKQKIDKSYKRDIEGHTYEDYTKDKEKRTNAVEWQMDCVQGIQGKEEPVLLTLQIVEIKFLFAFVITRQTAEKVIDKLAEFKNYFNEESFNKIFEILLTDNGHEFIKLDDLMKLLSKTSIYYCHPYSSFEKGSIENNHELLRRVIPQGVSLKIYSQEDINILCSHINSLFRNELDGKCPFELIDNFISLDILNKIGYKRVHPKDVTLTPELLGYKNVNNIKKYLSNDEIVKANISFKK